MIQLNCEDRCAWEGRRSNPYPRWRRCDTGFLLYVRNGEWRKKIFHRRDGKWKVAPIPLELSRLVDPEFSGLVRYIAGRYLARTDDGSAEGLYVRELAQEVATRPSGAIA
jgi:hypothetical protein